MSSLRNCLRDPRVRTLAKAGEFLGKCTVFAAVLAWIIEIPDRTQQRHNSAWALINSANAVSGDGGRTSALESLNSNGVNLSRIHLTNAEIPNVNLQDAVLVSAVFDNVNLEGARFGCTWKSWFYLQLRSALSHVYWFNKYCTDLSLATFKNETNLRNTDLSYAALFSVTFENCHGS